MWGHHFNLKKKLYFSYTHLLFRLRRHWFIYWGCMHYRHNRLVWFFQVSNKRKTLNVIIWTHRMREFSFLDELYLLNIKWNAIFESLNALGQMTSMTNTHTFQYQRHYSLFHLTNQRRTSGHTPYETPCSALHPAALLTGTPMCAWPLYSDPRSQTFAEAVASLVEAAE